MAINGFWIEQNNEFRTIKTTLAQAVCYIADHVHLCDIVGEVARMQTRNVMTVKPHPSVIISVTRDGVTIQCGMETWRIEPSEAYKQRANWHWWPALNNEEMNR